MDNIYARDCEQMECQLYNLEGCAFELLRENDVFLGIGAVEINNRKIRSGRLPLLPYTQTFSGLALGELKLLDINKTKIELRIKTRAAFYTMPLKAMRDHSFDPIHDLEDWDERVPAGDGILEIVIRTSGRDYFGYGFNGFSYHYEYSSENTPLFFIYDRASWEIDGNAAGCTVYNQSSCSPPVIRLDNETAWSTEGKLYWLDEEPGVNSVMTHNLPRWASHQCFDYQFKGNDTLIGVFERVDLIRSVVIKEKNKPELKVFDKHIFTETLTYKTSPKHIMLNRTSKTEVDQQNLWTWLIQELHDNARAEYGLYEEQPLPRIGMNFWEKFTLDSYYVDLLPAAVNTGIRSIFIDNVFKSDMSEGGTWNMCCAHEYEPAPGLSGFVGYKKFVDDCKNLGITPYSWTNNVQSLNSPLNYAERDEERNWYMKMEDTRTKFGGAYTSVISFMKFSNPEARQYWIGAKKKIKDDTGINSYLFDSFYNAAFMPIDYTGCKPKTNWRETLTLVKELQDADIHFMIESFGPFGEVQHGCHKEFNLDNLFICHKIMMGTGYTTIPSGNEEPRSDPYPAPELYKILSYMAKPCYDLYYGENATRRIDTLFTEEHKQAIRDYYACLPYIGRRVINEDGKSVLWQSQKDTVIWNYQEREVELSGNVIDVSTGKVMPKERIYKFEAGRTYRIIRWLNVHGKTD